MKYIIDIKTIEQNETVQEWYDEILSNHWQKLYQIKELINTNKNNHPLRMQSIADRKKEYIRIEEQKNAFETLFKEYIYVPTWYRERLNEL